MTEGFTGGCQCGAVRYRCDGLGRASICHCRMCQKAFGGFYGPLVATQGLVWTRGGPKHFHSSNRNWRGFCEECGTPLTYEFEGGVEIAIGTLDDPAAAPPTVQVNCADKLPFTDGLHVLPETAPAQAAEDAAEWNAGVVSRQHPDHDTDVWPPENGHG